MKDFIFQTTRSIIHESGAVSRLGEIMADQEVKSVLFVTDQGIRKAGLLDTAIESLEKKGITVTVFDEVQADPPDKIVLDALELSRRSKVDGVVGFGGGSSMDVAKLVAFLTPSSQQLSDIYGIGLARGKRLPLVQITTTAGTGSEVTPIAIVTTGKNEKKGVVAPQLLPDIAILDPDLTLKLPPQVTAATGVDAMVHAIEAYTSKVKKNPISDALAREGFKLLMNNIRSAVKTGENREARSNMLLGALLTGQAFANSPVGAVHALAYPIGGHFHVPHGLSNSLVLPHVMRFNAPEASREYAELARVVWPDAGNATDQELTERLISELESLIEEVGLQNHLSQVGVLEEHLPMMAEDAMKQQRLLVNNPREVTYEDAFRIYRQAL